jgi:hypothetical protein
VAESIAHKARRRPQRGRAADTDRLGETILGLESNCSTPARDRQEGR